jgi:energy-coupling factor transporter ATP-binding protein EcfA2
MIESLELRDFKGHRETTVRFAPLTVLVGPNGAGKTSVLEALHVLGQIHYKKFDEVFAAPRTPDSVCRHATGVDSFLLRALGAWSGGAQVRGRRFQRPGLPLRDVARLCEPRR